MDELTICDVVPDSDRREWNALAGSNPFMQFDYLSDLFESGSATPQTGWFARFIVLKRDGKLVAALPMYLKTHSRGEFVFDQAWAQAYQRHQIAYYPKAIVAVPFTPVQGPRLLAANEVDRRRLIDTALQYCREQQLSSLHVLFAHDEDVDFLQAYDFLIRRDIQFHFQNKGYRDIDDFLNALTRDKRKKIRQEQKKLLTNGIEFQWLSGSAISEKHLQFFYQCYVNTYHEHMSTPYLSYDFFARLAARNADAILLVLASRGDVPIACALNIKSQSVLYGRYWGALEYVPGLHFETCYLQAIMYCITHHIQTFEGGAQGEHKMARGMLPVVTRSAHWIADNRFKEAIAQHLIHESSAVDSYLAELQSASPFRQEE